MRITDLRTATVELPLPRPVSTAIHEMTSIGCVLVSLEAESGAVGEGFVFTLNGARIGAFDEMIRGLSHLVVGQDVYGAERIWHDVWAEINPTGHQGITVSALSAIDTACWDLAAKSVGLPLAKMFGQARDRVATYASSGLWLSATTASLCEEAQRFVAAGFTGVKMRIGRPDDVERVAAVRAVVGADIDLYVDANQAFTPKEAIRLGRKLEPYDLAWIEEPVPAYARVGHAEVRSALDTPIATGETDYTRYSMLELIQAGSADVLMPDLQRMGGYSEMRIAAATAAAHQVPVSTHFFTEYSLAFAGSTENCVSVEHIDWFEQLFVEPLELDAGHLLVPDRPGTGFSFDWDALDPFRVLNSST